MTFDLQLIFRRSSPSNRTPFYLLVTLNMQIVFSFQLEHDEDKMMIFRNSESKC